MQPYEHIALREACLAGDVGCAELVVVMKVQELLVLLGQLGDGCFHLLKAGFAVLGVGGLGALREDRGHREVIHRYCSPSAFFVEELQGGVWRWQ